MTKFGISSICSAFGNNVIGTRVMNQGDFLAVVDEALQSHDTSGDRVEGQHFVQLPEAAVSMVSAGVGRVEGQPVEHFVVREHRGEVNCYLHRAHAADADGVAAIVYTWDAYAADPEVDVLAPENAAMQCDGVTHVIVAVLAFAGPQSPLTTHRFVSNLAGGNKEALEWDANEIRSRAEVINSYWSEWRVVADHHEV